MNLVSLKNKWESFSATQKSVFIVMSIAIILSSIFFVQWLTKVEYGELFTGLDPNGAGQIVNRLNDMGAPYKISNQGTTILVPMDQVYALRLQLAATGVFAAGGTGFELFDESKIGITDFERQLNYQRALQEELRRTIVQLDVVEQARVHLVLPEQSLFVREQGQASASIAVKLAPMANLQPSQVLAIINLVSGSVERLEPQNVHVIDTQGRILSDGLMDSKGSFEITQAKNYEQKRIFEKDLEQRVQSLLQQILGIGRPVIMVTAELDYNHREVTKIEFGDAHIRSQQLLEEQHINRGQSGIAVDDNLQDIGTTYPEVDSSEGSSSIIDSVTNYELNQTQETIVYAPGRVVSLSTAVAIDGTLNEETVDAIQQIVGSAIGFNPERGDQIAVMSMAFDKKSLQEAEAQMAVSAAQIQKEEELKLYLSWIFKGLAVIFAFILLVMIVRIVGDVLKSPPAVKQPIPVAKMEEEVNRKEKPKDEMTLKQETIKKNAKEKPEETAILLKTWMMDD